MSQSFDIVVIGSGHNGLVAAAYLAAAGKNVAVLERNSWFGGGVITRELTVPGFKHDQHSTAHIFILGNPLIKNDDLGLLSRYGLKYVYPDVPFVCVFEDGATIGLHRDRNKTCQDIAQFSAKDADAFLKFAAVGETFCRWWRRPSMRRRCRWARAWRCSIRVRSDVNFSRSCIEARTTSSLRISRTNACACS